MRFAPDTSRRFSRCGFTLVEMLVVVGIILVLMGILLPVLSSVYEKKRKLLAEAEVALIRDAAILYHEQLSAFPPDTDDFGTGDTPEEVIDPYSIVTYLGKERTDIGTGKTYGPFLKLKLKFVKGGVGQEVYIDPWSHPYHMDALHTKVTPADKDGVPTDPKDVGKVLRLGSPYPKGTPEEKQVVEVKVFSDGSDGKWDAGSYAQEKDDQPIDGDNNDNIMSWRH
ncbi:MAG: type II secretion system protein [Planctomycetota bacterium]|nr:type II secretion system protein [Planctomycetota bacterium]